MARVKAPLKMADGTMVSNIDAIKEHFDLENMLGHFESGRLMTWLETFGYEDEAEALGELNVDAADFQKNFCAIFEVSYESSVDQEKIAEREERLKRLRQYTADENALKNVDKVAFDQGELADRLEEGCKEIYLCRTDEYSFRISASKKGIKYIGVNQPKAHLGGKLSDPLGIEFEGVEVDNLPKDSRIEQNAFVETKTHSETRQHSGGALVKELDTFKSRLEDLRNYKVVVWGHFHSSGKSVMAADDSESYKSKSDCSRAAERALETAYNEAVAGFEKCTNARSSNSIFATSKKELSNRISSLQEQLEKCRTAATSPLLDSILRQLTIKQILSQMESEYADIQQRYSPDSLYHFTSAIEYDEWDPSGFEEGLAKLFAFKRYGYSTYSATNDIERHLKEQFDDLQEDYNDVLSGLIESDLIEPIKEMLSQVYAILRKR